MEQQKDIEQRLKQYASRQRQLRTAVYKEEKIHSMDSSIGKLLVYGFTPMAVMTGALMKLMQYMQGDKLKAASVALYAVVVIAAVAGNTEYFDWYQPDYFKIWCFLCAAGILFGCCQFYKLSKKLVRFDEI